MSYKAMKPGTLSMLYKCLLLFLVNPEVVIREYAKVKMLALLIILRSYTVPHSCSPESNSWATAILQMPQTLRILRLAYG